MRIRRKTNQCLNCGYTLDSVYNYCPNCGQENNNNNVSIGTLIGEFFSTYFAVDSKFGRTVKPFFIQPGFLTNRYAEGKRASYAHPLRLYLIISLFFFFIFTLVGKKVAGENNSEGPVTVKTYDLEDIDDLDKQTVRALDSLLSDSTILNITGKLNDDDLKDFRKVLKQNLTKEEKDHLRKHMKEKSLELLGLDTLSVDTISAAPEKYDYGNEYYNYEPEYVQGDSSGFILERLDWKLINNLKDNKKYSDTQILDSMQLGELTAFEEHVARQAIRVQRADQEQIVEFILKNIPLMMLILIPIFALILKLLYVRRNQLYIKHLIHALHLHSFSYFLYGISLILGFFVLDEGGITSYIPLISFVLVSTYAYLSFLRVYRQGWFKTLVKFNILGFIYIFFISIFLMGEMVISMLLF